MVEVQRAEYYCEEVDGVLYPYAEVHPVVQGNQHFMTVKEATNMGEVLFLDGPNTGIYSDIMVFWEEGKPGKRRAPDLIVLPEVDDPRRLRRSLRLWEERSWPMFVLEVLSEKTEDEDLGGKFQDYQNEVRIPEYFICDPWRLPVDVWGFRLEGGRYEAMGTPADGRLWSEKLQAWIGVDDGGSFRIWNAAGVPMPTIAEAARRAEE